MDTVERLQNEIYTLKFASPVPPTAWTPAGSTQTGLIYDYESLKVQRIDQLDNTGMSNGWDDVMIALQPLSHLEGDALNMALLVSEATRVTQIGLVGALTDHYGSPGRLVDYRRQFEKTVRQDGKDPSQFAVALETLAVKAFRDMFWHRHLALHPLV